MDKIKLDLIPLVIKAKHNSIVSTVNDQCLTKHRKHRALNIWNLHTCNVRLTQQKYTSWVNKTETLCLNSNSQRFLILIFFPTIQFHYLAWVCLPYFVIVTTLEFYTQPQYFTTCITHLLRTISAHFNLYLIRMLKKNLSGI